MKIDKLTEIIIVSLIKLADGIDGQRNKEGS